MAQLNDTCLLYRGGKEALEAAKQGAAAVIDAGGTGSVLGQKCLFALDKRLLDLGVSPGGSADLLAGTLFLDAIERQQTEIRWSDRMDNTDAYPTPSFEIQLGSPWVAAYSIDKMTKTQTSSVRSDI